MVTMGAVVATVMTGDAHMERVIMRVMVKSPVRIMEMTVMIVKVTMVKTMMMVMGW
jgi:hypothetical protein